MEKVLKKVLEIEGFSDFNEIQKKAFDKKIFDKNLVISSPTGSGKTLLSFIACLHKCIKEKKKTVYTCPLKALTNEHFDDFKEKYAKAFDLKVAIATSDFDSSSTYLSNYDVIFTTYEKLHSLINHQAEWLSQIGLVVIDEIHEIDSSRGPVIEMIVVMMKAMNPKLQFIALSATIPNSKELAKWLDASLIESNQRPVDLHEGVYFDGKIYFSQDKKKSKELIHLKDNLQSLVKETIDYKKQALIFANTRKRSEQIAQKLAVFVGQQLSIEEKNELKKISEKILRVLEQPTVQCTNLAFCVSNGISFHHAGLLNDQRKLIEDAFRQGKVKVISSTPTLAAGVNLPAYRVILPYLNRFTNFGNERISVRSYKQMAGRAGRPKYDSFGESIMIAKSDFEIEQLFGEFVHGELEEVESKLSFEPVLRTYLLSLISNHFVHDRESMENIFSQTFYAFHYQDLQEIFFKLNEILKELKAWNFVELSEKNFKTTLLGKRVSELYLDPLSANQLILGLKTRKTFNSLTYLHLFSKTLELFPYQSIPKKSENVILAELMENQDQLIFDEKELYLDDDYLKKYFLSKIFSEWINECSDEKFLQDYNISPGILRSRLEIADWLAYCSIEIAKLIDLKNHFLPLNKIRTRLKYGVKEELVPLVQLKFIGRIRARRLFNHGFKGLAELKKANVDDIAKVINSATVAIKVKEQLGEKVDKTKMKALKQAEPEKIGQMNLDYFK